MDIQSLQYEALAAASRDLRMNFRQYWSSAFTPGRDGTAALIAPASYRLDIGGTRLLIDPVFRFGWEKEAVADRWISDLLSADGIIYTHSHADHYDPGTAYEAMKNMKTINQAMFKWYPDTATELGNMMNALMGGDIDADEFLQRGYDYWTKLKNDDKVTKYTFTG